MNESLDMSGKKVNSNDIISDKEIKFDEKYPTLEKLLTEFQELKEEEIREYFNNGNSNINNIFYVPGTNKKFVLVNVTEETARINHYPLYLVSKYDSRIEKDVSYLKEYENVDFDNVKIEGNKIKVGTLYKGEKGSAGFLGHSGDIAQTLYFEQSKV